MSYKRNKSGQEVFATLVTASTGAPYAGTPTCTFDSGVNTPGTEIGSGNGFFKAGIDLNDSDNSVLGVNWTGADCVPQGYTVSFQEGWLGMDVEMGVDSSGNLLARFAITDNLEPILHADVGLDPSTTQTVLRVGNSNHNANSVTRDNTTQTGAVYLATWNAGFAGFSIGDLFQLDVNMTLLYGANRQFSRIAAVNDWIKVASAANRDIWAGDVDGYPPHKRDAFMLAAVAGESNNTSGANPKFRVPNGSNNGQIRVDATTDSDGQRTAVTLNDTGL